MTFILFFLAVDLSLLLAGRALRRRAEITALARVKCPAGKSTNRSKDQI